MARRKPIYGPNGEVVGHSDTTGQGSKPSRAVREQKKPRSRPPATPPDQQDRQRQVRANNYRRGAAPTGGPGRAEVRRTRRVITKANQGKATVRDIQRELVRQGYDIALDGVWGPQTEYAWKQHLQGLATGQAGYQRDLYRRQQAYLKTALTAPPNYQAERKLFGEEGVKELERARQQLRGLVHEQRMAAFKAEESSQPKPSGSKGILGSIVEGAGRAKDIYQGIGETAGRAVWDVEKFNVEHLMDMVKRDPAGFAANPLAAFARTPEAANLAAGPELASAVQGQDFDKRWAVFEAALLPFRPLGVLKGVLRGGVAVRGGRKAVEEGFRKGYQSKSLVREYTVGKHVARREAARSRTGRAIEKLSDRLGNANIRAGKEQRYSTKFRMDLMEVSPQVLRSFKSRLRRVGRRLDDKQEYALRVIAEGMTPQERVAHHVALAQKSNLPHLQLYHLQHAGLSEEASKFVQLNPEWTPGVDVREVPRIILRKDAPRHLHQAWSWFQETGALREGLLQELSRLSDESIMGRLHAPGRVIAGARYKKYEQAVREELEADPARAQAFEWIDKNIQDPSEAQGLKTFYDYVIRSAAEQTDTPVSSILARISGVESKVKLEEIPELGAFYSTVAPEAVHTPAILPFREIAERIIAAGHALPDDIKTPVKLARKLDEVYSLVREGADYKDWYKRAAAVTATVAKQLDLDPITFAKVVGIMSQQANPTENLRRAVLAVKMFQETGEVTGFMPGQAKKVMEVLQGGDWEGRKTNSYYGNIIKYLDPKAKGSEAVTVDRHIARLFVSGDTPGKFYAGVEKIFQEMAGTLGWAPEEVQAAAWVPIKARNLQASTLKRGKQAKDVEAYMPSAADAYERGYTKYKGELFQRQEEAISKGVRATADDGGFTWNGDLTEFVPEKGYAASYGKYNVQLPVERFDEQAVRSFREAYDALLQADPNLKIGAWNDNGTVHLDLTQIFHSKDEALQFAERENQIAIWDYAKNEEIIVPEKPVGIPGPEGTDIAGFHKAAAEELDSYAALARDVANTLPEDEWPQWVKNQMRDQGESVVKGAEDLLKGAEGKPAPMLQNMLREIDGIPDEELRNAVTKAFGDMVSDPSPASLDEFGSWIQNKLFLEELQGTEELDALKKIHAMLPPVKGVTREMHGLPEKSIVPKEHDLERQLNIAIENEDYETAQILHNLITQGVQDELRSDIHRLPSGKFWVAGERKLFDTYGEAEAFKIPGIARATTEGELFQRTFAGAERLAEVDAQYNKIIKKLEKAVNPYPPGLREQARRNRRGSRRSRMGMRTTNQDRRILAEQKLDELIANHPEEMAGIKALVDERYELHKARAEWQDNLFQKGGELKIVSPYGIKGAVSFNADDIAKIFLTESADVTTLPHEMAHIMRRLMTPGQERQIAKAMGAKLTGPKGARTYQWDEAAEEKFAKVWEGMILHGLEPPGAKREFAALSKAFSEVLADAEVPNVPFHVAKVLRRMTEFTPRPGGKIMGAEDVLYGVEYAPTFRGMPFRPTQAHRQLSAYVKKASLALFGGGKRAAIGAGPDDPHLKKAYMGAALLSGAFKRDVIDPKADAATLAIRMSAAAVARKALVDAGTEIPRFADDIAVKVDPKVNAGDELGRFWDRVSELGERKLDQKDLEGVNWDLIETARKQVLPEEIDGKPIAQVAQEILDTERPIDNIVWVPREFVEASGLRYVPRAARYQERALKKWMRRSGMTWDVVNDLVKAQILWLNPAYAPVQFIGNTVMNLMHQGPWAAVSGWKSILMLREMELAERLTMDTAMGEGIGAAIRPSGAAFSTALDALHHYNSIASDVLPRRMAFLHEARRDNYKSLSDVGALLKAARQGDEQALQTLEQIARRARRSIVDFDRLSPFERDVVTRWIFFYPWLRAATDYSLNFVKDHPIQAAAIALMYEHYQAEQQDIIGDHPYYSNLDVPIGTGTVGLKVPWTSVDISLSDAVGDKQWRDENNNPMVFKMRQALTQTTPLELAQSFQSFGQGAREGGLDVVSHLTPLPYAAGVALFGYDPYEGREVKPGFLTFLNQLGFPTSGDTKSTAPIVDRFKQIFLTSPEERAKANENALYPRQRRHHVLRVGLGSLAPTPYSTEVGQERARKLKPTLERKTEELRLDAKEYGLEPPSDDVLEDLRVRTELDSGWRRLSDKERAERAAAAYDERYGTDQMSAFVSKLKSDPQAKKFYEALRPKIYPWLLAYERLIQAHEDAALSR